MILMVIQAYPFVIGFRVSPDDILYHWYALQGPLVWLEAASHFAKEQGRIGHFLSVPLMMAGAELSGLLAMRIMIVIAYFGVFLGAAYFVSLVLNKQLTCWIFLWLVSFNALGYSHLPPNAYPLLITIPLLCILAANIFLLRASKKAKEPSITKTVATFLILTIALLTHEYSMIFGGLLFGIECLVGLTSRSKRTFDNHGHSNQYVMQLIGKVNLLAILTASIAYGLFRFNFPSNYAGNTTQGIGSPLLALKTLLAHAYFGTSLGPAVTFQNIFISLPSLQTLAPLQIGGTLFVGMLTGVLCWILSQQIDCTNRWIWPMVIAVIFGVLCALPIAVTSKYQQWITSCSFQDGGIGCAYIDSRLSYIGYFCALALLPLSVLSLMISEIKKRYVRCTISLLLGLIGGYTYLHNWAVSEQMRQYVSPWKIANQLACTTSWKSMSATYLSEKIDPNHVLLYHSDFDQAQYWRVYLSKLAHSSSCR